MRWKTFIPIAVFAGLIAGFILFFLDPTVKRSIESIGTGINGARVELDDVDISLKGLSVTLLGLKVTDKDKPMTNALDIERMNIKLAGRPLAWKKVIIENAEISGIQTGTVRMKSGALPARKKDGREKGKETGEKEEEDEPDALTKKAGKLTKKAVSFSVANIKEQYDPKKLVKLEELSTYKRIKEERERFASIASEWESKVKAINVDDKVKNVESFIKSIKETKISKAEIIKRSKNVLDESKNLKKDLETVKVAVKDLKNTIRDETDRAKNSLKEIDTFKNNDIESILTQLKTKTFSAEGISHALLGDAMFKRIRDKLNWIKKIRGYIPKKKESEKQKSSAERTGKDITFPFRYNWPVFHLKKAVVEGTTPQDPPLSYKGILTDVTSDPKTVGNPIVLKIEGEKGDGSPEKINFVLEVDHTGDITSESIHFNYEGISVAGTKLGKLGAPVSIREGTCTITSDIKTQKNRISGDIRFFIKPIVLQYNLSNEQKKNKLYTILHDILTKLKEFDVNVALSDTISSPDLKVTTNIDGFLNDAVNKVLKKELEEIKARVKDYVNNLIEEEKQKLMDKLNEQMSLSTGKLNSKDALVKAVEDKLKNSLDGLNKEKEKYLAEINKAKEKAKQELEKVKTKAEEEAGKAEEKAREEAKKAEERAREEAKKAEDKAKEQLKKSLKGKSLKKMFGR